MPRIGLQLFTVRDHLDDLDRLFAEVAESGVTAVEPYGLGRPDVPLGDRVSRANDLARAAARAGLTIPSTHTFLPHPDGVEALVEEMSALGATTALAAVPESLAGFSRDVLDSAEGLDRYAQTLNELAAAATPHGLRIGYHNHAWEWAPLASGVPAYDHLLAQLSDDVVIELDVLWAQFAGQDPLEIIDRLGRRIRFLHIDDAAPVTNTDHQVPAGQGDVPLARAIAQAPADLEVLYIEATSPPPGLTHLDLVRQSAAWLRDQLGSPS